MSLKDVKQQFKCIEDAYLGMQDTVLDLNDFLQKHDERISEEQLEQAEMILAPLKRNYEVWSYVLYQLDAPNRKKKKKKYYQKTQDLQDYIKANKAWLEDQYQESRDALHNFKILAKEWKDEYKGTDK